jgi:beta-phosphoglucomutase
MGRLGMSLSMDFQHLKGVLIDFDGTLVDTIPFLFKHYLSFLKTFGQEGSLEEFKTLMGPSLEEFVPILIERYQLPKKKHALISLYYQGLVDTYKREGKLIPGAREFLDFCQHKKIKIGLVTSSAYPLIASCVEALEIKDYFAFIVTKENVKKTKPDPEIYLHALKTSSLLADQVVAIEDSRAGILAALNAHIPTIAIRNPYLISVPSGAMTTNSWKDLTLCFEEAYARL